MVDGQKWAVLTDKAFLIAIRGENKLPPVKADEERDILDMIRLQPKATKMTSVARLREFAAQDEFIRLFGFPVDSERLNRVLSKTRKEPEVALWDATGKLFDCRVLGLAIGSTWKAFLAGHTGKWADLPIYEFEEDPDDAARELFEQVMGEGQPAPVAPIESTASPAAPDEEQFPLPDQ